MPIRVLLVDDNDAFLETVARFLADDQQIEIVGQANSGPDALEQVEHLRPDLVLMDLAMPGMSGLEATRQIKARPTGPRVIILTLYDSPEYRAAAQELGADGFVVKSEFFDQLQPAIHTLFSQGPASAGQGPASAGQGPASAGQGPASAGQGPALAGQGPASAGQVSAKGPKELRMQNILVVDDSPTMRRMVIASLDELQGVSFDQAGSGLEAIERLALASVNLMILDLNMPDLNGLEVIKFTRQHNAYRALPIIVLTTRGDEASRAATLAAGATLYLTKPFGPADLTRHARELLGA